MPPVIQSRAIKSAALVGSGLASFSRTRRAAEATILTFHGLCENTGDPGILDWSLHLPMEMFRRICALLADGYRVIPLFDLIKAQNKRQSLPPNAVVITFDDGYESNFKLAHPILKKFDLPATIFVTTGFIDGEELLWFQRVDLALGRARKETIDWKINGRTLRLLLGTRALRQQSLMQLMPEMKQLPDADLLGEVGRLEQALGVDTPLPPDLPAPMRPLTWEMIREMKADGLVEIGGHTHTHPILSQCDPTAMRAEIFTCRDRIRAETGVQPVSFAYPNGREEDYTHGTMLLLREAGFQCACSTVNGRVGEEAPLLQLPRYGSPESVWEAEATVSGAFETLKEWRQSCLKAMSLI